VKDFNYTAVKEVLKECNRHLKTSQTLVLISTVLPGTIRRELSPIVTQTELLYNPYLIAMGTVSWDIINPEMIMIGSAEGKAGPRIQMLADFYNILCDNSPRLETGTFEDVEAMKVFFNTFVSTKIALVNMIQDVGQKLKNMDVDKVTQALAKCDQKIMSPAYMKPGMGDGGACHPRDNIALRWLAKELNLGYDIFETVMTAREKQAENMAKEILKHGNNIHCTSDFYKPGTNQVDGSSSLLLQHYIVKHGGQITNGFDSPIEVIVRIHESDKFEVDETTIIFDPWRTYPPGPNVIYYGQ
jgi:UDPglucose 6-dehydrogenase